MKNHKGFTIVELLIGMTILSIVAVALTGFIVSSSKSYAASNTEIIVQQESQLAMNQISDVIIDTTRSVNYVGYSLDGSVSEQVVKDSDFTIDVEDKSLVLYNGEGTVVVDADGNPVLDADGNPEIAKDADGKPIVTGGNGNKNYQIYWDKSEEKLFYSEIDISETDFPEDDRVLLAEYVKDFSVDLSQVEEKRVVKLTINYGYNNKVYETSNNITIRNKVLVNSVNLAVNKSVELNIRVKENVVYLEPNEEYRFSTPIIEGRNILDKSVTWSISAEAGSAPSDAGTKLTDIDNGILKISDAEKAVSFKVTVTTNAEDSAGNHASADVIVRVKRVTSLNLYKSWDEANDNGANNGANEISPGYKFTISAKVSGNWLGVTCSHCGDDTTIDKYLVPGRNLSGWSGRGWEIWDPEVYNDPIKEWWHPTEYLEMLSHDEHSATFYLKPNTPDDGTFGFVIGAMSLLSVTDNTEYGRHYDNFVAERITLKTKKPQKANISLGGDIRYGYATKVIVDNSDFNKGGQGYYIVCARIKTDPNAPVDKDMVMLYGTNGTDAWVTPDVYGLNMDKTYYISIQLIDQGGHLSGKDDPKVKEIVDEYKKKENIDSSGKYIGTKYPASDMISFTLNTPQIVYNYKDELYKGTEVTFDRICAVSDSAMINCPVVEITNARPETKNKVYFEVYKGEGDDSSKWTRIYGRTQGDSGYTGNATYGGLDFNGLGNPVSLLIKLEKGNVTSDVFGTYHCVPYIAYENKPDADHSYIRYWASYKYEDKYNKTEYYDRKNSTIHFTVTGGNMTKLIVYSDNKVRMGDTNFPLPSDVSSDGFTKYFDINELSDGNVHHSKSGIYLSLSGYNSENKGVYISDMTCQFIGGVYRLKLFFTYNDSSFGREVVLSAGTYQCAPNGEEWEFFDRGDLYDYYVKEDNNLQGISATATIIIEGEKYRAYLPIPSENEFVNQFGFDLNKLKNGEPQKCAWEPKKFKYGSGQEAAYKNIVCTYNATSKTYTLEVDCAGNESYFNNNQSKVKHLIFTFTEGDRSWTLKPDNN